MSPDQEKSNLNRRTVCDHCRRRRIRCDGGFPCQQCNNANLTCKRDHVPRKRGPKRGAGRVINELRAQERQEVVNYPSSSDQGGDSGQQSPARSHGSGTLSIAQWVDSVDPANATQDRFNTGSYDVISPSDHSPQPDYFSLVPTCADLFFEHLSPIMPVIHMPTMKHTVQRALTPPEQNLIYALCAVTSTHMSGKSIPTPPLPMMPPTVSWEIIGRFFLNECILARKSYDFIENLDLSAVISSYFVSIAFFELNMSRKSWYYLREALTLAQDLGLQDEATYQNLDPVEALCRRRTFWLLYVTERSFAIFRHKPLTLSKTPLLPTAADLHPYESATIHSGFMHLVHIYSLLDDSFVNSWNEAQNTGESALTFTHLQAALNNLNSLHQFGGPGNSLTLNDIQKADILVTQQWLRLVIWQTSMRQGLLSFSSADPSMTFRYPLQIAQSLLGAISSLPATSIEVHGMGIFEKIFEIGCSMVDVVQASGLGIESLSCPHSYYSTAWRGGMRDPFASFIQILSGNPNSQKMYANLLMAKAAEKPEIQRFGLVVSPSLRAETVGMLEEGGSSAQSGASSVHSASGQTEFVGPEVERNNDPERIYTASGSDSRSGSVVELPDDIEIIDTSSETAPDTPHISLPDLSESLSAPDIHNLQADDEPDLPPTISFQGPIVGRLNENTWFEQHGWDGNRVYDHADRVI